MFYTLVRVTDSKAEERKRMSANIVRPPGQGQGGQGRKRFVRKEYTDENTMSDMDSRAARSAEVAERMAEADAAAALAAEEEEYILVPGASLSLSIPFLLSVCPPTLSALLRFALTRSRSTYRPRHCPCLRRAVEGQEEARGGRTEEDRRLHPVPEAYCG